MLVFNTSPTLKGGKKDDWIKELQALDRADPTKIVKAMSNSESSPAQGAPHDGQANAACLVGVAGASSRNAFWLHHRCIDAIRELSETAYTALQLSLAVLRVVNRIDAEKGGPTWEYNNECDYQQYFMEGLDSSFTKDVKFIIDLCEKVREFVDDEDFNEDELRKQGY